MRNFNIGILAHVDAGKTTITEQMMLQSGTIRTAGTVDAGTTVTDCMEVERQRGITVQSASADIYYQDKNGGENRICLIDTPGHVDFAGEVERSLQVLDGAVLVFSAVEGIQAHTEQLWKALQQLQIPTIFVINKVDRTGSNVETVLSQMESVLGVDVLSFQTVTEEGSEQCSITVNPEEQAELNSLREEMKLYPVIITSAKTGLGIDVLLESIVAYLPDATVRQTEELSGVIFKISHSKEMGKAAYVRLYGGSLKNRDIVPVFGREKENWDKITQIRRYSGSRYKDTGVVEAGEIAAVYGLEHCKVGDSIGNGQVFRQCSIAMPLLMVQVSAKREAEEPKLWKALQEMEEEDALLHLERQEQTGEMFLQVTGKIQIEVLESMLAERYGLECNMSAARVIYKETVAKPGTGLEIYTMPKPCWAIVQLRVDPLPPGSGVRFVSVIKDKELPYRYQHHVEQSVMDTLRQGIYGWEVTDIQVTLIGGESHHEHTHPLDFFLATPIAFLRALTAAGAVLLEPLVQVHMVAEEVYLGKVIGQILDMRGTFESPEIKNGSFIMDAVLPVATSMDYPITFRSMTSGRGVYQARFHGYQQCPLELGAVRERLGVNPLDRDQWILSRRGAMQ